MAAPTGYVPFDPNSKTEPTGYVPYNPEQENVPPEDHSIGNDLAVMGAAYSAASNLAPWNRLTQMRQKVGGDIAEAGGYVGGYVGGKMAKAGFPNVGNDVGNAIQSGGVALGAIPAIGPEVLSAYTSLKGLYNPQNPIAVGIRKTPQQISPQYTAQNQAIGISNEIPETAGKVQYENPYQYASQLSKPKYVPIKQPDLPVVEPGAKTGDPHALFAYNDNFGPGGTPRSVYNVYGDQSHPALQARGWGSSVSAEDAQEAGIPITGRQPSSAKFDPIRPPTFQPVENPNAPAFTRPKLAYPADTGPGAAQPLPSTVPTKYPNDPGALINQANNRIAQFGPKLSPQELSDYHQLLSTQMGDGTIVKGTPLYAQAAKAQTSIVNTLGQAAEPLLKQAAQSGKLPPNMLQTRAYLNQAYGISKFPGEVKSGLKTAGKVAGEVGAIGSALYAAKQYIKHLAGGQ